jgi:hypothetical protein
MTALHDPQALYGALGASSEEIRAFAIDGLKRRLAIVGVSLESL